MLKVKKLLELLSTGLFTHIKIPSRHFILDDVCKYQVYQPTTPRTIAEGDMIKSRIPAFCLPTRNRRGQAGWTGQKKHSPTCGFASNPRARTARKQQSQSYNTNVKTTVIELLDCTNLEGNVQWITNADAPHRSGRHENLSGVQRITDANAPSDRRKKRTSSCANISGCWCLIMRWLRKDQHGGVQRITDASATRCRQKRIPSLEWNPSPLQNGEKHLISSHRM